MSVAVRRVHDMLSRERRWKLVSVGTGVLAGMLTKKLMRAMYQAVSKNSGRKTPFDPAYPRFSWLDALLWAPAAGVGLGIAKVMSARIAAFGWETATGTAPPVSAEEPTDDGPS
jgi:hypothetical protein